MPAAAETYVQCSADTAGNSGCQFEVTAAVDISEPSHCLPSMHVLPRQFEMAMHTAHTWVRLCGRETILSPCTALLRPVRSAASPARGPTGAEARESAREPRELERALRAPDIGTKVPYPGIYSRREGTRVPTGSPTCFKVQMPPAGVHCHWPQQGRRRRAARCRLAVQLTIQ